VVPVQRTISYFVSPAASRQPAWFEVGLKFPREVPDLALDMVSHPLPAIDPKRADDLARLARLDPGPPLRLPHRGTAVYELRPVACRHPGRALDDENPVLPVTRDTRDVSVPFPFCP